MDRTVERILVEWREAERQHDVATDDDTREVLQARIAELADEHRRAMEERLPTDERPDLGGVLGAEV